MNWNKLLPWRSESKEEPKDLSSRWIVIRKPTILRREAPVNEGADFVSHPDGTLEKVRDENEHGKVVINRSENRLPMKAGGPVD